MVNNKKQQHAEGFALLLTLLVVTVLISIGISVLSLSISQVRLATNARDSEVAFHAANAGMECALYWRRAASSTMENGQSILPIGCFGIVFPASDYQQSQIVTGVTGGEVYRYQYEFTWGPTESRRCSRIDTIVGSSSPSGPGLEIQNMRDYIKGFPGETKECAAGTKCSVISVQGYNKPCNSIDAYGTVQREVLLQL